MFSITTIVLTVCYLAANHQVMGNGRGQSVHHGHGSHMHMAKYEHYFPKPDGSGTVKSVLKEDKLIHDTEHLKEDLKQIYSEEEIFKMATEEIEFHYFKMHDHDSNLLLDGIEMLSALAHVTPYDVDLDLGKLSDGRALNFNEQEKLKAARERQHHQMNHFIKIIDEMMKESDKNKDGFINYQEYRSSLRPSGL